MAGEKPPQDILDKIADLERRLKELERRVNQVPAAKTDTK